MTTQMQINEQTDIVQDGAPIESGVLEGFERVDGGVVYSVFVATEVSA